mmetsp:Transcript_44904/g.116291  ORF Transcript_44904/g.116291 Transcript_44904/m.116291 type:complete len:238 (+) Transcript_44904:323-1036(+)
MACCTVWPRNLCRWRLKGLAPRRRRPVTAPAAAAAGGFGHSDTSCTATWCTAALRTSTAAPSTAERRCCWGSGSLRRRSSRKRGSCCGSRRGTWRRCCCATAPATRTASGRRATSTRWPGCWRAWPATRRPPAAGRRRMTTGAGCWVSCRKSLVASPRYGSAGWNCTRCNSCWARSRGPLTMASQYAQSRGAMSWQPCNPSFSNRGASLWRFLGQVDGGCPVRRRLNTASASTACRP